MVGLDGSVAVLKCQLDGVVGVVEVEEVQSFTSDYGTDGIFFTSTRKSRLFILKYSFLKD